VTSATVLTASAAEADGLSTAFVVLGVEGTEAFCRDNPEVRAIVVPAAEDGAIVAQRINFARG
jgi:thiamine biosynthesis lipoprotein ApbE